MAQGVGSAVMFVFELHCGLPTADRF
jgi:hypothetical protein